jgi:hypothetical protein
MTDQPAKNRGRFKKGQSGNPRGRPRLESVEVRKRIAAHSVELVDKLVAMAVGGDMAALRECMARICPPLKPSALPLPVIDGIGQGAEEQRRTILSAALRGELSVDDAVRLVALLAMGDPAAVDAGKKELAHAAALAVIGSGRFQPARAPLGKKAQADLDAMTAADGTEWADLLPAHSSWRQP